MFNQKMLSMLKSARSKKTRYTTSPEEVISNPQQ